MELHQGYSRKRAMNTQLIITHPGNAHFDEVTAISLIQSVHADAEFSVERRDPTQEELDDRNVWVVDIGNNYEPEKRNFDHHQSQDCPASFVLVAKYLGIGETLAVLPWWHFKDIVDRFGPVEASITHNAGDHLVNRSPVETWLMEIFAAEPESSLPLLKSFGTHIIDEATVLKHQIEYWKICRRLVINGIPAIIGETTESAGLEEFRRAEEHPPDIVISLDRRSEGWRLFRYDGTSVDFTLIADCSEIAFTHKSGFMAKTKDRLPIEDLIAIVKKAIIS